MQIRAFVADDRPAVVALWSTVFPGATGHNDPQQSIDRKLDARDGLFFVATDERTLIGTVMGGYDGHRGWIYSLAVEPSRQRQGVGTLLVRHVESALIERGCPKVNLQVRAQSADVVAFYVALGYHVEERISMGKIL